MRSVFCFERAAPTPHNGQPYAQVERVTPTLRPRLTAVDGPLQGKTYVLDSPQTSIGRGPGNAIVIEDPSVSRRHCAICRTPEGRYEVSDLSSRNGTVVNGLPVRARLLEDGDEIRLGKCVFCFRLTADDVERETSVSFEEGGSNTFSLVQLRREDSLYLSPQKLLEAPVVSARIARNLTALLKISANLQTVRGAGELARRLLELTLEAIPAERGAILLFEPGSDEPVWAYLLDRESGPGGTLQAQLPIVRQAWRDGVAILSSAPVEPHSPGTGESLITRMLAAPVASLERTVGVIYLESADPLVRFDQEHLQVAAAIGGLCGTAVECARRLEWLESENDRLRQELNIEHDMVGTGPRMREVYRFIGKVAASEATVLLSGESGAGKELVARAIHRNSARAAGPFVGINCATLTEPLLESELFGHEKGAFTGAVATRKGKLETAAGGTVFLDEVGELTPALQAKLLRVIQEREFERVGGNRPLRADVRLIAASNRDLGSEVARGAFRKDLYYRLNVVPLTLPPLRERREDIPVLAAHFATKHSKRSRPSAPEISPQAMACLMAYDWPGNVRELENAIEHAIVLGSSSIIHPEDLPETVLDTAPAAAAAVGSYQEAILETKKRLVLHAIEQAGGIFTDAARLLGVHPNYLHRLVRNLNLKSEIKSSGL